VAEQRQDDDDQDHQDCHADQKPHATIIPPWAENTSMSELIEWLTACIDEDETAAKAALAGPWHIDRDPLQGLRIMDGRGLVVTWTPGFYDRGDADAAHIALHDPARVLREVEAKRAILALTFYYEAKIDGEWGCGHRHADAIRLGKCPSTPPEKIDALRALAAVYADRPGYKAEWG